MFYEYLTHIGLYTANVFGLLTRDQRLLCEKFVGWVRQMVRMVRHSTFGLLITQLFWTTIELHELRPTTTGCS